jgi:uncharacterized protein (DUF2237 family)
MGDVPTTQVSKWDDQVLGHPQREGDRVARSHDSPHRRLFPLRPGDRWHPGERR